MITQMNIDPQLISPSENNPNRMLPGQYEVLVGAIKRFGFLSSILVRPNPAGKGYQVVDGHHRLRAAQEIGLTEIPIIVKMDSDDGEANALQIGMNRLRGELDLSATAKIIEQLKSEEGWKSDDLMLLGFSEDELSALMSTDESFEDLPESMELPSDDTVSATPNPFVLEIEFENKEDLKEAKRKLKKAAGKTGSLTIGLLNLLRGE